MAPFLTLDGNPYPVVANGQIPGWWTATRHRPVPVLPAGEHEPGHGDERRPGRAPGRPAHGDINYIRNSVKAVVNAYTGSVTLYAWDASDPILRTWMNAFPGIIKPKSQIPAALMPHLRYPPGPVRGAAPDPDPVPRPVRPGLLRRAELLGRAGQPRLVRPTRSPASQPPYYHTMQMPGAAQPQFSLMTSLAQRRRHNMAAYLAVNSNPLSAADYGRIQILQLPQNTAIPGPQQVNNDVQSDPTASLELTSSARAAPRSPTAT